MTVLITGGCGFIGSQVVREYLKSGHKVVVFDNLGYSGFADHIKDTDAYFVKGDLRNKADLEFLFSLQGPFDLVVHIAAESSVDKSIKDYGDFISTNVLGASNLFSLCVEKRVPKVINFATDEIFGQLNPGDPSFSEQSQIKPRNIYSASKAAQYLFANAFKETFNLPVINVCPSNCYGPRQLPEKLLPRMIYLIENGKDLPVYGTGLNIREWLFVGDVASAVMLLGEKGVVGETYNIGSENERSNLDILKTLGEIMDKEIHISFIEDRKGHDFRYSVNCDKIKALGWKPSTSLEQGLETTVEWYRENWSWLETNYKAIWK